MGGAVPGVDDKN